MLSEIANISSVGSNYIRIESNKAGTCNSCSLKPSCGQYFLSSLYKNRELEMPKTLIRNDQSVHSLQKGSLVQINIEETKLVQLALTLYLLPLLSMLLTAFLAHLAGVHELLIMVLVISVLFLNMKILNHYFSKQGSIEKINIRVLPENKMELST